MKRKIVFLCCAVCVFSFQYSLKTMAISDIQKDAIVDRCDYIKEDLKRVQREDSKVRVYLGGYYEAILTKFITPLNMRLVENNLSSAKFVENQNDYVSVRTLFSDDFITYQKSLEELVGLDCKSEPEKFYDNLKIVRQKRKVMVQDILRIRSLISGHIRLVEELKGKV